MTAAQNASRFYTSFYSFVLASSFSTAASASCKIPAAIVRIENGFDIARAVDGEGCDLRHGGAGDRQAHHRGALQIVKRQVADTSTVRQLAPGRREPVAGPRAACSRRCGRLPRSLMDRIQHDHRYLALGFELIVGVGRPKFERHFPKSEAFLARYCPGPSVHLPGPDLYFDVRVRENISIPPWVLGRASL